MQCCDAAHDGVVVVAVHVAFGLVFVTVYILDDKNDAEDHHHHHCLKVMMTMKLLL